MLTPGMCEYLRFLPAVVKPKTLKLHYAALGRFSRFLRENALDEDELSRADLEKWLVVLANDRLTATTRQCYIYRVRRYFYWRHERGDLKTDPERLLSIADQPKRPRLLPRPIPPELDAEILRRLRASPLLYHRAIHLKRKTGLRASELWSLPTDCVKQDTIGNSYLKVPLGKMDNERLVPLDQETTVLITTIQSQSELARKTAGVLPTGPTKLVYGPVHNDTFYRHIRQAFKKITADLYSAESLCLHRLRHTYATELLNAGMSLFGVMHILGHRHIGTTLIYAAIVQETVREEYFAALEKIKSKYVTAQPISPNVSVPLSPIQLADDLARSLRRLRGSADPDARGHIRRLLKNLDYLRGELKTL